MMRSRRGRLSFRGDKAWAAADGDCSERTPDAAFKAAPGIEVVEVEEDGADGEKARVERSGSAAEEKRGEKNSDEGRAEDADA